MFRQVAPAPCSPPLGGSDGISAVRFTPAVKYGGRENWPPGRAARCMSSHPCRAHHKLKWARKMLSALKLLYKHLSRSESRKAISTQSSAVSQTSTGQPCLTGVGNNPLTITKPSQRAVSRMPKARRSRLSLIRRAGWATFLPHLSPCRPPNSSLHLLPA